MSSETKEWFEFSKEKKGPNYLWGPLACVVCILLYPKLCLFYEFNFGLVRHCLLAVI